MKIEALRSTCKKLSGLVIILLLSACTTTSFQSKTSEYTGVTPVSAVYVYSFLDLREGNLGKKFLAEVKRQLDEALAKDGIRVKQLWFNDSPLRAQFSLAEIGPHPSNTSTRVPVDEVIKDKLVSSLSLRQEPEFVISPAGWPWLPLIPFNISIKSQ